jgi:hypothetical protein
MRHRYLLLTCMTGLLAGCLAQGTRVDQTSLPDWIEGQTPCQMIVARYGEPQQLTRRADGSQQIVYSYTQTEITPVSYVPVVSLFVRSSSQEMTSTTFECTSAGILESYSSQRGQTTTGTGILSGGKQR